jgi:hypothetical protein
LEHTPKYSKGQIVLHKETHKIYTLQGVTQKAYLVVSYDDSWSGYVDFSQLDRQCIPCDKTAIILYT